jgi:hypothetical protein
MDPHTKDVLDLYKQYTNEKIELLRGDVRKGFREQKDLHEKQQTEIQDLKNFKSRITYFSGGVVAVLVLFMDWIKLGAKHIKDLIGG